MKPRCPPEARGKKVSARGEAGCPIGHPSIDTASPLAVNANNTSRPKDRSRLQSARYRGLAPVDQQCAPERQTVTPDAVITERAWRFCITTKSDSMNHTPDPSHYQTHREAVITPLGHVGNDPPECQRTCCRRQGKRPRLRRRTAENTLLSHQTKAWRCRRPPMLEAIASSAYETAR